MATAESIKETKSTSQLPGHTTVPAPQTKAQNSKLLQLPPELRNRIYEMIHYQPDGISIAGREWTRNYPALLRTCRQIHTETDSIYYTINKFYVNAHEPVDAALRKIGQRNRSLLQVLRIFTHTSYTARVHRNAAEHLRDLESTHVKLAMQGLGLPTTVLGIQFDFKWFTVHDLELLLAQEVGGKVDKVA